MSRRGAVLGAVHVALQVLHARTHGEGLALQLKAAGVQELEDVAGGVAAGEDHGIAGDSIGRDGTARRVGGLHGDAAYLARRPALDVREPAAEAHRAAQRPDARNDRLHHVGQDVRADVRLGVPEDLARGARLHEGLQDEPVIGIARARGELAVRERSSAAQTELDVALGVEFSRAIETRHAVRAPTGVVAPLDEQRLEPRLGEGERAEEAGAASSHHHGTLRKGSTGRLEPGPGRGRGVEHRHVRSVACGNLGDYRAIREAATQGQTGARNKVDVFLLTRVHGHAGEFRSLDIRRMQAQDLERSPTRGGEKPLLIATGIQRHPYVRHLDHAKPRFRQRLRAPTILANELPGAQTQAAFAHMPPPGTQLETGNASSLIWSACRRRIPNRRDSFS